MYEKLLPLKNMQNGIEARPFAGGSVLGSNKGGACGTMGHK